jgi:amino acid adenylation domain-containing protein
MNSIDATIHGRFAAVVADRPGAVAIDGDRRVSYAQLDGWADAIAALLPAAVPEAGLVAILAEDRATALAAMLGTARSGHAYVPLDPGDPEERLRFILEDSHPLAIVADAAHADRARSVAGGARPVLVIDDEPLEPPARPRPSPAGPDSMLFVLYTSGSQGRPKGVRQTHRNLLFYADSYATTLGIRPGDRLSLLYTLSFSAASMDIYGGLLRGATLCPRDLRREGVPGLSAWLTDRRITILHTVPTVLREWIRSVGPGHSFPDLRAIDLGGETLFAEDVRRVSSLIRPECLVVNHLAATELSVIAQHVIRAGAPPLQGTVPAGHSPPGVELAILTADGRPACPGEVGRIAIESVHLSPGYWRRPEADAAFVDVPQRPGWRRFLTDDRGSIDAHGVLHFRGREGTRVKLNGQTIDLHEVEAALLACDDVSEAAVAAVGDAGREARRLVAWVVPASGNAATPRELRRRLAARLPGFMVPSAYVITRELPRTDTGKVDRRRLADAATVAGGVRPAYEPPANDDERAVATVFSRVLGCDQVGRSDDFFLLGGDSLRAVELQLALRSEFGRDVPDLVDHSTVAECAARLRDPTPRPAAAMPRLVPLRTGGGRPPLHLVHGRLGQAFISPGFAAIFPPDQPLFAIQARGLDGLEPPARTVADMAADYVAAIRLATPGGPYFLGALCAGSYVAIEMANALVKAGHSVLPLLLFDPPEPWSSSSTGRGEVERQIHRRHEQNRISAPVGDARLLGAAVEVAQCLETAVRRHTPDGLLSPAGAFVLFSRGRLREQWTDRSLTHIFGDAVECAVVGDSHADVLDPANADFAAALRQCLARIDAGVDPRSNVHLLDVPHESFIRRCRRGWRRFWRGHGV